MLNNNKEDISMIEILQAINDFATKIEERFNQIEERFNLVDERFIAIDRRFDYIENRLGRIEKNMATKNQLNSLLGVLERKNVINKYEVHHIKQVEGAIN